MNDKIIEKINTILQTDSLKNIYSNYFKDKLHNKVVKISIVDITLELYIKFKDENMTLSIDENQQDVEISGTLSSFIFYSAVGGNELYSSKININQIKSAAKSVSLSNIESDLISKNKLSLVNKNSSIYPAENPFQGIPTSHKIDLLKKLNVESLIIHPFSKSFSRISANEFIRDIIVKSSNDKISFKAALAVSPKYLLKGKRKSKNSKIRVVFDACFR